MDGEPINIMTDWMRLDAITRYCSDFCSCDPGVGL